MAGDRPVLLGLLIYLLLAATPTLFFWLVLRVLPHAVDKFDDWRARRHGPPRACLESSVATLHRLRRDMRIGNHPTQVRRLALQEAYDRTLIEVCGFVGLDAPLGSAGETDRPFARLLTEAELENAGIVLDPPGRGAAAA